MSLDDLPLPLLVDVFQHVLLRGVGTAWTDGSVSAGVDDITNLALVSKATRAAVNHAQLHQLYVRQMFGPLDYAAYFQLHGFDPAPGPAAWRHVGAALTASLRPILGTSVKKSLCWLRVRRLLASSAEDAPSEAGDPPPRRQLEYEHSALRHEHEWLFWLISTSPLLTLRRRIVAYVCQTAELHPARHLDAFIARFRLCPAEEEPAAPADAAHAPLPVLRRVLLQFPFLPIDAGGGADRVIGALARVYVASLPQCPEWLGQPPLTQPPPPQRLQQRAEMAHPQEQAMVQHGQAGAGAAGEEGEGWGKAVEAIHLVLYSLIMLNTDLNNPAVQPKMSASEFQASLYRIALLRTLDPDRIARMYADIAAHPLRIDPLRAGVDTIIRAATDGGADEVSPAVLSRYSSGRAASAPRVLVGVERRVRQLRDRQGRAELWFQLKRWQGAHYVEIQCCAMLLVLVVVAAELWWHCNPAAPLSGESHRIPAGVLSALAAVTVLHVLTRY